MRLQMNKLEVIIPWIIAAISSVATWRTIKSTENIARFNAYFSCKANAYNNFIEQLCFFTLNPSAPVEPLAAANYQAAIYASDDVRAALLHLSMQITECTRTGLPLSKIDVNPILNAMQKDLESTGKFSSHNPLHPGTLRRKLSPAPKRR